ncbi:hypothetical protein NL452_27150, partial [Klebsiella pneumoniae]|nr:hypothetical protein [Klebsiella pneumoniae]
RHLRIAADTCEAAPDQARDMDVDAEEIASWRRVADQIYVPYDEALGVHPMNENFTAYREWRFEDKTTQYPVQENNHYAKFYRR